MQKSDSRELLVFIKRTEFACTERGQTMGRQAWLTLRPDKGSLCLSCADMEHLLFLPYGDPARPHALGTERRRAAVEPRTCATARRVTTACWLEASIGGNHAWRRKPT